MELILVIFTLGYLFQHAASFLLIQQLRRKPTVEGMAEETQVLFLLGAVVRIFWVTDTRLLYFPLIWIELILSIVFGGYAVYLFIKLRHTRIENISNPFSYKLLIPLCAVLSFFFHPGAKNQYYLTIQMLVSLTMFLEASGMLPQIWVMRKAGFIELNTGTYILLLGVSRLIRMVFWVMMYLEGDSFLYLILADLLHTILLGDFVYSYFKHKKGNLIMLA